MATANLAAGSIWRRWEPHVHLPGTLFEDKYGATTIEEALDALAACTPPIEVVGVTDYFTTRSFRAAQAAWTDGAGAGISYLFPNVELRLNDVTAAGNGVNLHVLSAPGDIDVLDSLLARLNFSHQDNEYSADDSGLIDLGRAFKNNPTLDEVAARREGARQFKVSFDQLKTLFQKDAKLREKCLVGVAAGKDGAGGLRATDGGFVALRQGMQRFAHIIFSGNENDRAFWVGHGTDTVEKLQKEYNGLKACLHGSDAHRLEDLGKPDLDRYTWLKGDPLFGTLWQACLAPERRTSIGSTNPASGQQGRICSVSIDDDSWFTAGTVPLNTGLVAVIGPRGSGKTALADLIAVGAGSAEPFDNDHSFVMRARALLTDSTSSVGWFEDDDTQHSLSARGSMPPGATRVRYLSQQFVEQLCAADGVTNELLQEIERVIFEAWPIERRQGATSFQELLDIRLGSVRQAQRDELASIADIGEAITDQRVIQRGQAKKQEQRGAVGKTLAALEGQIKDLTGKADTASSERHGAVSSALAAKQGALQTVDRRLTDLKALHSAVASSRAAGFPQFLQRLQDQRPNTGFSDEQWQAFLPAFSGDVDGVLMSAISSAESDYRTIAGPEPTPGDRPLEGLPAVDTESFASHTIKELMAEQGRLQGLVGLDRRRAAKLTQLQQQSTAAQAQAAKLDGELNEANGAEDRVQKLVATRSERYASYFNALLAEETELRELYGPLDQILQAFGPSVSKLKLSVHRRVDLPAWVEAGERLIDLRTAGPFRGTGGLVPIAEAKLSGVWQSGNGEEAAAAIQQFSQENSGALREHSPAVTRGNDHAYRDWERGVSRWLYNVEHIRVSYSLEYDGLDVERLSPGSRGIVLLLLYLAVDQSETDPLIIDQPEENLDPKSVYAELVDLFQSASERRQIIMITHNANLVVNTDVDQVIVAAADSLEEGKLPRLSYMAGGLETPSIRQAVCDVLEGGAEAFRQRARRLHIDAPAAAKIDD